MCVVTKSHVQTQTQHVSPFLEAFWLTQCSSQLQAYWFLLKTQIFLKQLLTVVLSIKQEEIVHLLGTISSSGWIHIWCCSEYLGQQVGVCGTENNGAFWLNNLLADTKLPDSVSELSFTLPTLHFAETLLETNLFLVSFCCLSRKGPIGALLSVGIWFSLFFTLILLPFYLDKHLLMHWNAPYETYLFIFSFIHVCWFSVKFSTGRFHIVNSKTLDP